MLEFMDDVAVGAVEDVHGYGLDRGAQAMLIAQSDQPGESGRHEVEQIAQVCRNPVLPRCWSPTTMRPDAATPPPGGRQSRRWSPGAGCYWGMWACRCRSCRLW